MKSELHVWRLPYAGEIRDVARAVGSVRLRSAGFGLIVFLVIIVVGGNASPIWWSGLIPTLLVGPVAWGLLSASWGMHLTISARYSTAFVIFAATCLVALISLFVNGLTTDGAVFWASAYLSPLVLGVLIQAVRPRPREVALLACAIAIGAAIPLSLGVVAYLQEWGIPTGVEFLLARYDQARMAGYMHATFGNTSNTAAFLVLLIPTLFSACMQKEACISGRPVLYIALGLAVLNALIIQSRTLFFLIFPALTLIAYFHRIQLWRVVLILAFAGALVVLPALAALDRLMELTFGALRGSVADQSVAERLEAMSAGMRLLADNPGFGIGPSRALSENPYTSAHQFWIQQGSELGFAGLLLSLLLTGSVLGATGRCVLRGRGDPDNTLRFTFLIGPACYLIYAALANATLAQSVVNSWIGLFAICLAIAARAEAGSAAAPTQTKTMSKVNEFE